jgi:hypothetical protein
MIAETETAPPQSVVGADQLQRWRDDGFLVLPGFFSADRIAAVADEVDELLRRHSSLINVNNLRCRFLTNVRTDECQFECFDPVIDLSLGCHRLALDSKLLAVLGALHGEEACLFKDKLIYKPPGVKGYDLHQDFISWPDFPRSFTTVVIPFDRVDRENGCTEVFPGYHAAGLLTPEDGEFHLLPEQAVDDSRAVPLILDPGDIAIFTAFTPHRSAPNRSGRWRRQFFPSYNKLSDGGHQRPKHYEDFQRWLRGKYAAYGKTDTYFR